MPTLRAIRDRIASLENIHQVTNAMRMVAAAKFRRAQTDLLRTRPYARRMGDILSHAASLVSGDPMLVQREARAVGLVVVTSNRGLCGSFNADILRRARSFLERSEEGRVRPICVGRKGRDAFVRRGYDLLGDYVDVFQNLSFAHAREIAEDIARLYTTQVLDRVVVVYNEFRPSLQQFVVVEQILPIEPHPPAGDAYFLDYVYEPSPEAILSMLLPRHLNVQIWRILLESNAAEQGARMAAMESATSNANELLEDLALRLNRIRQTAITAELSDIVGGTEAAR